MPILPIMDLLILIGSALVGIGALLKAVYVTTSYRPTLLGLGPLDCAIAAGVFLLFALALAARTWVKASEQDALAIRRAQLESADMHFGSTGGSEATPSGEERPVSSAGGRG